MIFVMPGVEFFHEALETHQFCGLFLLSKDGEGREGWFDCEPVSFTPSAHFTTRGQAGSPTPVGHPLGVLRMFHSSAGEGSTENPQGHSTALCDTTPSP